MWAPPTGCVETVVKNFNRIRTFSLAGSLFGLAVIGTAALQYILLEGRFTV